VSSLLARLIVFTTRLARAVPVQLGLPTERAAISLMRLSRHLPPMPGTSLTPGVPFLGEAACSDISCLSTWAIFFPSGADRDIELVCSECGQDTGFVV
jgi:hypothetical protein